MFLSKIDLSYLSLFHLPVDYFIVQLILFVGPNLVEAIDCQRGRLQASSLYNIYTSIDKTSATTGLWKCNIPPFQKIMPGRPTDATNQPNNRLKI